MNRAHQDKLAHEVNMTLINIRAAEVNYFNDFFGNFGIQAGVLVAIILANVGGLAGSNVSGAEEDSAGMDLRAGGIGSPAFAYIFFYSSAISIVVGMHLLICTILCSVFGQGLALRGPIGSMVNAITGMVEEQRSIVNFFGLLCVTFNLSLIGLFGMLLDQNNAICMSIIFSLGLYMWYHYSLRIYNRFYYNGFYHIDYEKENIADNLEVLSERIRSFSKDSDRDKMKGGKPKVNRFKLFRNPLKPSKGDATSGYAADKSISLRSSLTQSNGGSSFNVDISSDNDSQKLFRPHNFNSSEGHNQVELNGINAGERKNNGEDDVVEGGYLSVKVSKRFSSNWQRRYFVFKGSLVFYYKDRRSFLEAPHNPINSRPIMLEGYTVVAKTTTTPCMIMLTPATEEDNRKVWRFRCDTLNEFQRWMKIFSEAFQNLDKDDSFVAVNPGLLKATDEEDFREEMKSITAASDTDSGQKKSYKNLMKVILEDQAK